MSLYNKVLLSFPDVLPRFVELVITVIIVIIMREPWNWGQIQ